MEYKTLGTIIFEVTGVIPDIETSRQLGLMLKDNGRLMGHYIYVKEPSREENKIITTRAYDAHGQEVIAEILDNLIAEKRKKEIYNLLKDYVENDMFPYVETM